MENEEKNILKHYQNFGFKYKPYYMRRNLYLDYEPSIRFYAHLDKKEIPIHFIISNQNEAFANYMFTYKSAIEGDIYIAKGIETPSYKCINIYGIILYDNYKFLNDYF